MSFSACTQIFKWWLKLTTAHTSNQEFSRGSSLLSLYLNLNDVVKTKRLLLQYIIYLEVKRYNIIYLEVKRYNIIYLEVKMYNIIYFGSKEVYKCFVFVKCS